MTQQFEAEPERNALLEQKEGIQWIEYDPSNYSDIQSHTDMLVTNGHRVLIAWHANIGNGVYGWVINQSIIGWVTHYARINLPEVGLEITSIGATE